MTPSAFRAALAALGYSQAAFARLLVSYGHPAKDVARSVRRWAQEGGPGAPGEVAVIVALLTRINDIEGYALEMAEMYV